MKNLSTNQLKQANTLVYRLYQETGLTDFLKASHIIVNLLNVQTPNYEHKNKCIRCHKEDKWHIYQVCETCYKTN